MITIILYIIVKEYLKKRILKLVSSNIVTLYSYYLLFDFIFSIDEKDLKSLIHTIYLIYSNRYLPPTILFDIPILTDYTLL